MVTPSAHGGASCPILDETRHCNDLPCPVDCEVIQTRSSWLNCAFRDDEAVYWVSIEHYEAEAVGN